VEVEGQIVGDELAKLILVITQLAEELDGNTLDLALWFVPRMVGRSARGHRPAGRASGCRA
jgi:hypothetical protein